MVVYTLGGGIPNCRGAHPGGACFLGLGNHFGTGRRFLAWFGALLDRLPHRNSHKGRAFNPSSHKAVIFVCPQECSFLVEFSFRRVFVDAFGLSTPFELSQPLAGSNLD